MFWTEERTTHLANLLAGGLSFGEAAKVLGVTKNAAIGKAHRLGLVSKNEAPLFGPGVSSETAQKRSQSAALTRLQNKQAALNVFEKRTLPPTVTHPFRPAFTPSRPTARACEYIVGDRRPWPTCGASVVRGAYCAEHAARCFVMVAA